MQIKLEDSKEYFGQLQFLLKLFQILIFKLFFKRYN